MHDLLGMFLKIGFGVTVKQSACPMRPSPAIAVLPLPYRHRYERGTGDFGH